MRRGERLAAVRVQVRQSGLTYGGRRPRTSAGPAGRRAGEKVGRPRVKCTVEAQPELEGYANASGAQRRGTSDLQLTA